MNQSQIHNTLRAADCEIRLDDLTRQLYATDASIYQIRPIGVAFPRTPMEAVSAIRHAADAGVSVIPRGAGTGLAGGAVGDGLIVDFARYNRRITEFNIEKRTVRVDPGVVLDQLNAFLAPHDFGFGPDVATSSRATLGGMIANNSSGAHCPVYGCTSDHIESVDVLLADGTTATVGQNADGLPEHRKAVEEIIRRYDFAIREKLRDDCMKRWPGYAFDDYLKRPGDLTQLIGGSEGTLAGITSAVVNVVPLPEKRGIGVFFFASVMDAMQATVEFLDLKPVAIEHIDRPLFDETKGKLTFRKARDLMKLDTDPCEAILIVEFYDDCDQKLAELENRDIGLRKIICRDPAAQFLVWEVRKAGLSLVTACKGEAKPVPGLEDVCVRPEQLPEYVEGLQKILRPLGVEGSYYGHAASGELHVRPKVNLHTAEDIAKYRQAVSEVSALCKQFKASFAAEHGVGIARTEFLPEHLGPELMEAGRELKRAFDPKNVFNPGKIVPDGIQYRLDENLRQGAGHRIELPFEPVLGYIERDESFVGNLEQCNGCGGCRKDPPTMCPTYIATGEEIMVTRGRANTIRAAMEGQFGNGHSLMSDELAMALDHCLSCKACKTECPSNVDIAQLKADINYAKHRRHGVPLLDRMIANADLLGRLNAGWLAPLSNAILRTKLTRWLMSRALGFTTERPLPPYASYRFDKWFARHRNGRNAARGKVILFDDTWVRYNEPNIGQAAVKVLEAAEFEVELPTGRKCCGRPAMSRGVLDEVDRLGRHNVAHFNGQGGDEPIIFLEPSCYSMFIDDYLNLRIARADKVARRCVTFEQFIYDLLQREPDAIRFNGEALNVGIHAHCHTKALTDPGIMPRLVERIPNASARLLDTGCCGMAGAFGMLESKYELSKQVGKDLVDKINALEPGTKLVASGTSCRHQIDHLTNAHPMHMAELLANAID